MDEEIRCAEQKRGCLFLSFGVGSQQLPQSHRIRITDPNNSFQSAFGGLAALSNTIGQLALDATNGDLYIADTGNSAIRKIEYGTGIITTIAGGNLGGYAGTLSIWIILI